MARTYTRTGNRFVVIAPAPSPEELLSGTGVAQNEYDLNIQLTDVENDTLLGKIKLDSGELKDATVAVDLGFGRRVYALVSGTYSGEGSELFLAM
jgi:hypothetical protein